MWIQLFFCLLFIFLRVRFSNGHGGELERQTLMISFDGFRWDYAERIRRLSQEARRKSNIWRLIENGAFAPRGIQSVFSTITFPNHYSLVTGLYQESHGVISNVIYDPIENRTSNLRSDPNDEWVYGGEPIWKTLMKQSHMHEHGEVVGCSMWVACQFGKFKNFRPFSFDVRWETRVDEAVEWLTHESTKLVLLYHYEPDGVGHANGTSTVDMDRMLLSIDSMVGTLLEKLEEQNLFDEINLLIVSDHGMMDAVDWNKPVLPDDLPKDLFYVRVEQPSQWLVEPMRGRFDDTVAYFRQFPNLDVIEKAKMPERWHYNNTERVMPLLVMAKPGYSLRATMKGFHGYDNAVSQMRPTFVAHGPAFVANSSVSAEMSVVDVYLLLCTILDAKPAPNNGTSVHFKDFVKSAFLGAEEGSIVPYVPLVTFVVSVSGVAFALGMFLCYRCRKAAHRSPVQGRGHEKNHFMYKPLPLESIGPLLTTTAADLDLEDSDDFEDVGEEMPRSKKP